MHLKRLLGALALCAHFISPAFAWDPELGVTPRPLTKVEYVDGTKVDLEALRGNPVVLYFGGDWCEPCVNRGRPAVVEVMKKYRAKGLQVVFVSMDDNVFREAKVRESKALGIPIAMAKLGLCAPRQCPIGLRDQGEFGFIHNYPTAVILDSAGIVRAKHTGGRGVEGGLDSSVQKVLVK